MDDDFKLRLAPASGSVQQQNDRLQLLLNLTNQITSKLELRELLRAAAANIREVMQCDGALITLIEPASGDFRVYAIDFPQSRGLAREEDIVTSRGVAKRALETLKPVISITSDRDNYPPEVYDILAGEGVKSNCLIPLVNRGKVLGVLLIARTTEASFTPDDVDFLSQAAGQIAIAIEMPWRIARSPTLRTNSPKRSSISKKRFVFGGGPYI